MTLKEKLEEKVQKYLSKEGTPVVNGTICYAGIQEDVLMPDGQRIPLHRVCYKSWVIKDEIVHLNVIYITPDTEELYMKVTPHYFKFINDGES